MIRLSKHERNFPSNGPPARGKSVSAREASDFKKPYLTLLITHSNYSNFKIINLLLKLKYVYISNTVLGFPGGSVVKSPPANAGDTGSLCGLGKIPHAVEHLSLCATTFEPVLERAWEPQQESSPHLPQLEKSPCSSDNPAQPKITNK